jgi:2,3-dihydroxybenzoate-AMP ligase
MTASRSPCSAAIGPETVYLASLPIAHNFALASPGIQAVFQNGGKVVLTNSTEPADAFALIEHERVTMTALVPALALRWLEAPERAQFDLSSLRLLQVGGARLNPELARRITPTLGCQLQQVFGMAEGLLNYTRLDDPEEEIVETQGRPCSPDDEIRIVDDDDDDVPPGQSGNLLARGPYTIRGYYKAPEHNQRAFHQRWLLPDWRRGPPEPWRQLDGRRGREKDMINRGGEKISAEEIENLILAHPSVFNVAVVAMPDLVPGRTHVRVCDPETGGEPDLPGANRLPQAAADRYLQVAGAVRAAGKLSPDQRRQGVKEGPPRGHCPQVESGRKAVERA